LAASCLMPCNTIPTVRISLRPAAPDPPTPAPCTEITNTIKTKRALILDLYGVRMCLHTKNIISTHVFASTHYVLEGSPARHGAHRHERSPSLRASALGFWSCCPEGQIGLNSDVLGRNMPSGKGCMQLRKPAHYGYNTTCPTGGAAGIHLQPHRADVTVDGVYRTQVLVYTLPYRCRARENDVHLFMGIIGRKCCKGCTGGNRSATFAILCREGGPRHGPQCSPAMPTHAALTADAPPPPLTLLS
jgi:hypothetical protein